MDKMQDDLGELINKMEEQGHDFQEDPVLFRWLNVNYYFQLLVSKLSDEEAAALELSEEDSSKLN